MVLFYLSDYIIQQDGDSRDCYFWGSVLKPFCCMRQCMSLSDVSLHSITNFNVFFFLITLGKHHFLIKRNCQYICSFSFFFLLLQEEFGMHGSVAYKDSKCVNKFPARDMKLQIEKKKHFNLPHQTFLHCCDLKLKKKGSKTKFAMKLNHPRLFESCYLTSSANCGYFAICRVYYII